jgi:hypothetical protein
MFDKNLIEKMLREDALTAEEERLVDQTLADDAISPKIVQSLPEEQVSLAWRSRLNEQVLSIAAKTRKKARVLAIWRPALGLGLAGALAIVFTVSQPGKSGPEYTRVEAALVQVHTETVQAAELAGVGLATHEAVASRTVDDAYNWSEVDIETL